MADTRLRALTIVALGALAAACESTPTSTPDASAADTGAAEDTGAVTDVVAADTAPVAPAFTYRPEGCSYEVGAAPRSTNNRLGDDTVFGPTPAPRSVHVNWASDPATTAAVLWTTDEATLATVVEYGTSMTTLDRTARGFRSTASQFANGAAHVHEVHLCGLTPDTTYYYRVGGPGHFSPVHRFKTAPAPGARDADVTFVVTGDSRADSEHPENFPRDWAMVQSRVRAMGAMQPPDFQLFTGDAVLLGFVQRSWDEWFAAATESFANMPWVMVHGNHEATAVNYLAQFAQPQGAGGELYFALDYGPVHLVVLNDSGNEAYLRAETAWLERDLMAVDRARTPWVVVSHHRAPYSTSSHGDDADVLALRAAWTPIYDRHRVDLVLNGHDHNLQQTHPLRAGARVMPGEGTVYMVVGGAGAPLYGVSPDARMRHVERTHNFVMAHATARTFELTPYRADGTTIAEARLTLTRGGASPGP